MRYINNINTTKPTISGTWVNYGTESGSKLDTNRCLLDMTKGELLFSSTHMNNQQSCVSHAYNTGNYYNLPSQLGDALNNNVCPKGWSLPGGSDRNGYSSLLIAYGIDNDAIKMAKTYDAALLNMPISLLRSGFYGADGALRNRGDDGTLRMPSYSLYFYSSNIYLTGGIYADRGYSLRCGERN